jgi:hypothetical protein
MNKIVMLTKTELAIAMIAIPLIATFAIAFTAGPGVDANAESYGVYLQAAGTVIKLASDGTEILRLPQDKLGLGGRRAAGVHIYHADGTIWVNSYVPVRRLQLIYPPMERKFLQVGQYHRVM